MIESLMTGFMVIGLMASLTIALTLLLIVPRRREVAGTTTATWGWVSGQPPGSLREARCRDFTGPRLALKGQRPQRLNSR